MRSSETDCGSRVTGWQVTQHELSDDHVALACSVLHQHRVAFVVIGGVAARLHDTGHATVDIDICPSRTSDNLRRLALAVGELNARLRIEGDPEGLPFDPHPEALAKVTTFGHSHKCLNSPTTDRSRLLGSLGSELSQKAGGLRCFGDLHVSFQK